MGTLGSWLLVWCCASIAGELLHNALLVRRLRAARVPMEFMRTGQLGYAEGLYWDWRESQGLPIQRRWVVARRIRALNFLAACLGFLVLLGRR